MPETVRSSPLRTVALCGAVLAWLALILQLILLIQSQAAEGHSAARALLIYFGFFTILTNGLCALVYTALAISPAPPRALAVFRRPWLVTAAGTCIIMVGSVYVLVLRRFWNPTGLQLWVDVALHYVLPLLFLALWWLAVPARTLRWRDLARITLYPLAYLVYVVARGAITGLYPYFFVDVSNLGLPATLRNAIGLLAITLALASVLIGINLRRSVRPRRGAA